MARGHTDATSFALFSPDGKIMATAADDKMLIIWDVSDRYHPAELGRVPAGDDATHHMTFSPDSRTLATAGWDGLIRLYDLTDPRKPVEKARISGHSGQVQAVQFTPDGRTLVSSGEDKTIRVWNISGPATLVRTIQAHDKLVHAVALNRAGTTIASSSWDGTAKLWDLATGDHLATIVLSFTNFSSDAVAFSPDGGMLATGAENEGVRLWDVKDLRNPALLGTASGHDSSVHALAFSPDGRFLATGGGDKSTRIWDITDPRDIRLAAGLAGHTDSVWSVAFSPDSRQMVTATTDAEVRVLDVANLNYPRHNWTTWKLDYDRGGKFFATASSDGTVKLWRPDDRHAEEISTLPKLTPGDEAATVDISADGNLLFASTYSASVLWDVRDPAKPRELSRAITGTAPLVAATFSHDGRSLAVSEDNGLIGLWNVTDPAKPVQTGSFAVRKADTVWQIEFSQDDHTLVVANGSRELQLWDVRDPAKPRAHPALRTDDNPDPIRRGGQAGREEIMTVVIHGDVMAFANMGSSGALYDISDPAQPRKLGSLPNDGGPLQRLAFSPDGTHIAAGTTDDAVRVWDVRDPRNPQVRAVLHGHTERVWGVAFAPDNRTLATTGTDRTVRIWDIDVEATAARVCATTTAHLSTRHWEHYFPGVDPRPLC